MTEQFHKLDSMFTFMLLSAVTVKQYSDYWVRCMAKIIKIIIHNNSS